MQNFMKYIIVMSGIPKGLNYIEAAGIPETYFYSLGKSF